MRPVDDARALVRAWGDSCPPEAPPWAVERWPGFLSWIFAASWFGAALFAPGPTSPWDLVVTWPGGQDSATYPTREEAVDAFDVLLRGAAAWPSGMSLAIEPTPAYRKGNLF